MAKSQELSLIEGSGGLTVQNSFLECFKKWLSRNQKVFFSDDDGALKYEIK